MDNIYLWQHNFILKIIEDGLKIPAQVKEDSILIIWLASHFFLIEYTYEDIQYDIISVLAFLLLFQHDS